jgi:hypothetical protein
MRDEFFGDINDYHKYGLLRVLTHKGEFRTGVCWMRRRDEGSAGGYLNMPGRWRKYDHELFETLRRVLTVKRTIRQAERLEFLPRKKFLFFGDDISDDNVERERYFDRMLEKFHDVKLIFFDPDNGLEIKSLPRGRKGSSKYLYRDEVCRTFRKGKSVLIYQQFPPKPRKPFIAQKLKAVKKCTGAAKMYAFRTSRVVFFLAVQPKHREYFQRRIAELERSCWHAEKQIVVFRDEGQRR